MLKSHLKLYVTQLPAALLATLVLLTFITQPAHADFRKALTAYQNRDGKTMLKEVEDAVDKKNDDGLILFLSVLEADTWMANLHEKMPTYKPLPPVEEFYKEKADLAVVPKKLSPVEKILPHEQLLHLVDLLKAAAINGNSVSQSRFFWLMRALEVVEISSYAGVYEKAFAGTKQTQQELYEAQDTLYSWRQTPSGDWVGHIKDETKGLKLLRQALARPDAHLYWGQLSGTLSQYYYDKYQKKKNVYFLRQAYAWAVLDFTNKVFFAGYIYNGTPTVISEMQKNGLLKKIAPELSAVLTSHPIDSQGYDQEKKRLSDLKRYQAILQSIQQIALPDLITKNPKIDLKKQPVLSLSRINYDSWQTMMDGVYMTNAGTSILNFDIQLYEDGRVIFSQGQNSTNSFRNSENLLKISPQEVSDLLAKAKSSGILESPRVAVGTQDYSYIWCASAECQISFASNYAITFRDKKTFQTYKFIGGDLTPSFAKVFRLLEEAIPTQQYRCGTDKEHFYYKYCVNRDKQLFDIASQDESK